MPPRITSSELLRQWAKANELEWETRVLKCQGDRHGSTNPEVLGHGSGDFSSGDVFFSFPPPVAAAAPDAPAVVRRTPLYLCTTCAFTEIRAGRRFDGAGVFVERKHQGRTLEELPRTVYDHVVEGMTLLDQLHRNLEAAAKGKAPEQPS